MVYRIYGRYVGTYEGTQYGHLYTDEPLDPPHVGRKPVTLKCKPASLALLVTDVDCDYNVDTNHRGQVVAISKV